jgi:protein TonB
MYSEENRALKYAIAASIVLHGVLLFGVSQRDRARVGESQLPSILARLVEAPAPVPVAAPPAPHAAPVKRPATRAKPELPKRLVQQTPAPTAEPALEPAIVEAPAADGPAESVVSEPSAPQSVGKAEDASPAAPATLAAAPAAGSIEDPGLLEKYRLQLKVAAAEYKLYPRVARDNNWEGLVALRMAFGANGSVASLNVIRTSGHDVLDRQAVEMFKSAAAAVPVPPLLRGKAFAFDVAVSYGFSE